MTRRHLLASLVVLAASCRQPQPLRPAEPAPLEVTRLLGESGRSVGIALHVDEPAGIERRNEPVLASIPLPESLGVRHADELSLLTESGAPVPCQGTVLARWRSGEARWVLLAFATDLGSRRTRAFRVVKRKIDLAPRAPVKATGDALETAGMKVRLGGKAPFSVEGLVERATLLLRTGEGEVVHEGVPASVEVLEKGPVRGVARVHGAFQGSPLTFTLTVEVWAGRRDLRLALETRCSDPEVARAVKIAELALNVRTPRAASSAATPEGERPLAAPDALRVEQGEEGFTLSVEGGAALARGRSHQGWARLGSGESSLLVGIARPGSRAPWAIRMAPRELTVRFVGPGEGAVEKRWLGDLQQRTDEAILAFGASSEESSATWPLFGQTRAAWVRDAGGLMGPLADDSDEAAALAAAGLDVAPPGKAAASRADFEVGNPDLKWNTESDSARDLLVSWLRTGDRAALDEGRAWARLYRDRDAPRTPGFEWRERKAVAGAEAKAVLRSRNLDSHLYGEGLLAHYLLTGDRGSLEAAIDMGEVVLARFSSMRPEDPIVETRAFARPFQLAVALLEVTGEERWRRLVEKFVATSFASPVRDRGRGCYAFKLYVGDFNLEIDDAPARFPGCAAKGFFAKGPKKLSVKGERAAFVFQDRELAHALARAFEVTGDERARQALLGLGEYWAREGFVPALGKPELEVVPFFTLPYVPEPEVSRTPAPSYPIYASNLGCVAAAAYLVSGEPRYLEAARKALRISALRGHRDFRPLGSDERKTRVGTRDRWAYGWDDQRTFLAFGKVGPRTAVRIAAPRDVRARPGAKEGTVEIAWAGSEKAIRYVVQGAPLPIEEFGDGVRSVGAFGADVLSIVPADGRKNLSVVVPAPGMRYFIVRAEDERGMLSPLSNVAEVQRD